MKKILLIPIACCFLFAGKAQTHAAKTQPTEVMVNGMPYSVYKAQQDGLSQSKSNASTHDKQVNMTGIPAGNIAQKNIQEKEPLSTGKRRAFAKEQKDEMKKIQVEGKAKDQALKARTEATTLPH
ncbi:MAG: hypothetical protein ABIT58_10520 [Ferruginibacter sp.]